MDIEFIWVFVGEGSQFPSGVFTSLGVGEKWIKKNELSGVITRYPLDSGVYDWAIMNGFFTPKKEEHKSPLFIGKFTSASMEHYHFENGEVD
jgi:hypothetical protein